MRHVGSQVILYYFAHLVAKRRLLQQLSHAIRANCTKHVTEKRDSPLMKKVHFG